ncbi:type II toxin-antitoxin system RelE/ParE family toxin [Limnohabitans sp. JirII-31]|uniref:type II toxin-antitoxin system RelE/ParE family toxin n=1 Tax=Limnohabitans sp. JirII-31 TaxID=1977908 RepID=UPI000C1E34F2|nr:type II toxin-antitoxin system RelE/ParE family toxin [Limnohabitans sp. JirII-31]PIT74650.1 plasmid stabilization protein [Limnohabitans sp. JirII-31]
MTRYALRFTEEAQEDLLRLFDFLLQFDLDVALRAREAMEDSLKLLEQFPFTCRKAANGAHGPRLRELVMSFGATGYVALFEIDDATTVTVLAIRHQREEDFH